MFPCCEDDTELLSDEQRSDVTLVCVIGDEDDRANTGLHETQKKDTEAFNNNNRPLLTSVTHVRPHLSIDLSPHCVKGAPNTLWLMGVSHLLLTYRTEQNRTEQNLYFIRQVLRT